MDRRQLLKALPSTIIVSSGCVGPDGSDNPSTASDRNSETEGSAKDLCSRAFSDHSRPTDSCGDTEFTKSDIISESAETTSEGETPSTFNDYLVVHLTTNSNNPLELRGCIVALEKGEDTPKPVSRTLQSGQEEYQIKFGPFPHHGVSRFEMWIKGCSAQIRWPKDCSPKEVA